MTPIISLAAYGTLGISLSVSNGFYHGVGLLLVLITLALSMVALRAPWSNAMERTAGAWLGPMLGVVVALGLMGLMVRRPGIYVPPETSLVWYRAGLIAVGLISLGYAAAGRFAPRWRFPAIALIYLALGIWVIEIVPSPAADVWHVQQRAVQLLLRGEDPYAAFYTNIYGHTGLYGSGNLKDGRLYSLIYPPVVPILGIPGWLLVGDVRLSLLAAVAGTAVLVVAAGRALGLPAGHVAELGAIALLFHPRGYFLIEQAWVDPYLGLGAAAVCWALARHRRWPIRIALGIYLGAKQYAFLWLPILLGRSCPGRLRPRDAVGGIIVAAIIALPFLVWDVDGFWRGMVLSPITNPFRMDSLSGLVVVARATGIVLPAAISLVAAAAVIVCAIRWRRDRPGEVALGGAAVFLAFFAFNKQAFLNYYWFAGVFLILAATEAIAGAQRESARS